MWSMGTAGRESGAEGRLRLRPNLPKTCDLANERGQDRAGIQVGHQETRQRRTHRNIDMTPPFSRTPCKLGRPSLVTPINAARKQCTPPGGAGHLDRYPASDLSLPGILDSTEARTMVTRRMPNGENPAPSQRRTGPRQRQFQLGRGEPKGSRQRSD